MTPGPPSSPSMACFQAQISHYPTEAYGCTLVNFGTWFLQSILVPQTNLRDIGPVHISSISVRASMQFRKVAPAGAHWVPLVLNVATLFEFYFVLERSSEEGVARR